MIPQIIHYCWFGKNKKPQIAVDCIETWKHFFPGWEIIEWNEDNYDLTSIPYIDDAYKLKKWAFVSDLVRLDVLYRYGGIYLDVDVEFIKCLPEEFLNYRGFMGFEHTKTIAPGLIFGVEKEDIFIKQVLESYEGEHFYYNKNGIYKTINTRITNALVEMGLVKNNEYQVVDGFHIFPSEYFCGYNTDIREPEITDKTICWHHYLGSWSNPSLKIRLQDILKKIVGVNNYKKILNTIREKRKQNGIT
ncbi:hypothetical protein B5F29_01080 [Lachnoclostridium sp. An196]|uniref:glycosyltransferase family 32 protein n=1 Tax=Lachnoclostridium sp. An196 TaxID=1965583 RepID=UPI000B3AC2EA|nr:glycosyltransferase [Lachnoclostridium sp. An196]OUP22364.1 hypothetical protein B5F29_01080 [Lachnoclostridium sp. An196]